MTTSKAVNQELQVLETLRAHRKRHRQGLPTQITAHVEQPIKPLTVGQKFQMRWQEQWALGSSSSFKAFVFWVGLLITL